MSQRQHGEIGRQAARSVRNQGAEAWGILCGFCCNQAVLSAGTMENFRGRLSQTFIPTLKMDSSYKVDEGYSEDTRSQDGLESPMGMDSQGPESANLLQPHIMSAAGLTSAVSSFSEAEKAGMSNAHSLEPKSKHC